MSEAGITRPQSHARDRNQAHGSFATRAPSSAHTEIAVALMERVHVTLADRRSRGNRLVGLLWTADLHS
jgi:hypothetical protein